ncbi:lasso RiPP family leader peptide-containing protein [Nonomuraea sp. PA05]|nr:lasso RiPP family leader peptide-containing protein [Nonomuraea sp. PA05]TYB58884.1 lasso RiPP family leader peptide-containing protein [Nonomuraea sp. PA05]
MDKQAPYLPPSLEEAGDFAEVTRGHGPYHRRDWRRRYFG